MSTVLPHEGPAAALLREMGGAGFLDSAARPFALAPTKPPKRPPSRRELLRSQPTLLVNGCGRSGTHALVGLLRRNGVSALHEGHGREATIGWPYVGRLEGSWKEYWPMSNQPQGSDVHEPIFKVHRNPLSVVRSIAAGLTSSGGCRNPSERRWEARAWRCAKRFIPLPMVPQADIESQTTCKLDKAVRMQLALHYWVKWNLLADRWAAHTFAVETITVGDLLRRWCDHCDASKTCTCPQVAADAVRASRGLALNASHPVHATAPTPSSGGSERVRARKNHGKRPPLTWAELELVDANMTRVARLLAAEYGYSTTDRA